MVRSYRSSFLHHSEGDLWPSFRLIPVFESQKAHFYCRIYHFQLPRQYRFVPQCHGVGRLWELCCVGGCCPPWKLGDRLHHLPCSLPELGTKQNDQRYGWRWPGRNQSMRWLCDLFTNRSLPQVRRLFHRHFTHPQELWKLCQLYVRHNVPRALRRDVQQTTWS